MRKPIRHVAVDGTVSYRVRYKLKVGDKWTERSLAFRGDPEREVKEAADQFAKMVHALGGAEALEWQRRHEAAPLEDVSSPTLDEWSETYIDMRTGITDGTRHGYRRTYALTYKPHLGHKRLHEITRADIAVALNELGSTGGRKGKGYSDKSIANAHLLLASMFKEAVAEEVIVRNPCARIKLPRTSSERSRLDMHLLSEADFYKLANEIPEHYRPLVIMLGGTGMRWGEAEALEVRDVDLKAKTVRISKAAKWDTSKAQRSIGPTKTRMSNRTVTLPDVVVVAIAPLLKGRPKSARLFTAPRGGVLRHKSFWQEAWVPACIAAKLTDPRPSPHSLRHSHASWLIAQGAPLPVIQARLGHSSITVTVDTYGHLSPDIQVAAADAANRVLSFKPDGDGSSDRPAIEEAS